VHWSIITGGAYVWLAMGEICTALEPRTVGKPWLFFLKVIKKME